MPVLDYLHYIEELYDRLIEIFKEAENGNYENAEKICIETCREEESRLVEDFCNIVRKVGKECRRDSATSLVEERCLSYCRSLLDNIRQILDSAKSGRSSVIFGKVYLSYLALLRAVELLIRKLTLLELDKFKILHLVASRSHEFEILIPDKDGTTLSLQDREVEPLTPLLPHNITHLVEVTRKLVKRLSNFVENLEEEETLTLFDMYARKLLKTIGVKTIYNIAVVLEKA